MAYLSQMLKEIASFKQNASIFVKISVVFNWVPQKKLYQKTKTEHERVTNEIVAFYNE